MSPSCWRNIADERAGRPVADGVGDAADRFAFGQPAQRVHEALALAPLRDRQPGLGREEALQRPAARPDLGGETVQRALGARVGGEQVAQRLRPRIGRPGHRQRRLRERGELVDQDADEPLVLRHPQVERARLHGMEDELAGEGGHVHRPQAARQRSQLGAEVEGAHGHAAVELDAERHARRRPEGAVRGHDPLPVRGADGHDAAGGEHQMIPTGAVGRITVPLGWVTE